MTPFELVDAIGAPLPLDNVDTDAIIPSRESQSVVRDGYGEKLFANWRYQPGTRIEQPEFVLNRAPFHRAGVLLAGRNFGCGSSREAAVWSLVQFGIRCVIAESYGAIFLRNCVPNGLLAITLDGATIERLLSVVETARFTVDLPGRQLLVTGESPIEFAIDPLDQEMLVEGLDEIELTKRRHDAIRTFQVADRVARPWVWNARSKESA
ncbi:MAG: 3-isopropylmalate dehydratase small subunit [Acidimicrobiia bacterium]